MKLMGLGVNSDGKTKFDYKGLQEKGLKPYYEFGNFSTGQKKYARFWLKCRNCEVLDFNNFYEIRDV